MSHSRALRGARPLTRNRRRAHPRRVPDPQGAPHGKPLVFLDSAASSQKPIQVIDAMDDYYRRYHANIHRGVYHISELATEAYEEARARSRASSARPSAAECIYVRNATEGINLVAYSWGRPNIRAGDAIVAHRDGTSLQSRAVADPRAAERMRSCASCRVTRRRFARPHPSRRAARRRQAVRVHGGQQHAGHDQPRRASDRARARGRRGRASSTRASRCRACRVDVPRLGRRLRRVLGAQDAGSDGHRHALGPQGDA